MARLRRIFYDNIGHPEARFLNLELPFAAGDSPATDSVVLLKNGGGKSALLSLFFNVMRPALREFLGQKADDGIRTLDDYVLRDDHGAVVIEWELDGADPAAHTPARLLTGAFLERKTGRPTEGDTDGAVERLFFSYYVQPDAPTTHLEQLPLYANPERTARYAGSGFKARLDELALEVPHAQVFTTRTQGEWLALLEARGIDADLFLYQIRMNQREGGAKDLFKACTGVADYVNLFLEVLIDRQWGENVRSNLAAQREALIDRQVRLLPTRTLTEALLRSLTPVADIARRRRGLQQDGQRLATRFQALAGYAGRRLHATREAIAGFADLIREAEAEARALRDRALRERVAAAERGRDIALVTVREAAAEQQRITERHAELSRLAAGWTAAAPLRDALRLEERARGYREQVTARMREHQPFHERLVDAANRYLGALRSHEQVLTDRVTEATQQQSAYEDRVREAEHAARAAAEQIGGHTASAQQEDRLDTALRREHQELVDIGTLLTPEEPLPVASHRLIQAARDAHREEVAAAAAVTDAHNALQRALAQEQQDEATRAHCDLEWREHDRELTQAITEAEHVATLPRLLEVLEVATVDATALHTDSVVLLRARAREAFERSVQAHARVTALRETADALRDAGLLPAPADVRRVLDVLTPHLTQAHAGWRYLADVMTPAAASAVVERAPDIAMGVVVGDHEYEAALEWLRREQPPVRTPVRVVRQSAVTAGDASSGYVVRGVTDAYFDREAGQRALVTTEAQLETAEREWREADADQSAYATTATQLEQFLARYDAAWFVAQRERVATTAAELAQATQAAARARDAVVAARDLERDRREAAHAAERRREAATRRSDDLDSFRRRHGDDLEVHRRAAATSRARVREAEARIVALASAAEEARLAAGEVAGILNGLAGDRAVLAEAMSAVLYADPAAPPVPGDRDALGAAYRQAKDAYEAKIDDRGLVTLAERDEQDAIRKRAEFRKALKQGWTEDAVHELLRSIQDASDVEARAYASLQEARALFSQQGNHSKTLAIAEAARDKAREACVEAGIPQTAAQEDARLAELPVDVDRVARAEWEHEQDAALGRAAQADADALTADNTAREAADELNAAKVVETKLGADLALLMAARNQRQAFLDGFAVDQDTVVALAPAEDAAFHTEIAPWSDALGQLATAWSALDAERDTAVRGTTHLIGLPEYLRVRDAFLARLQEATPEQVEAHVEELLQNVQLRLDTTLASITDVDRHRAQLVDHLLLAGEEGRRRLRSLITRSMIPASVPFFGGHPFLKASGLEAADAALERAAIESLLDRLTGAPSGAAEESALTLVQQAVHALAPTLRIQVLFPKPKQTVEYWPIVKLGKMSGGEGLTVAMLLYCTLARVRAMSLGKAATASSVLLFDNPFGIASSATFITLQREVARALRVQLIYFTGVLDQEAISLLPNRVRLGNSRFDRAAGHTFIERLVGDSATSADALAGEYQQLSAVQATVDESYLHRADPVAV